MKKASSLGSAPTHQETLNGLVYLAFQLFLLPAILQWFNGRLSRPLNTAELNFVFFFINFLAVLLIFYSYLGKNLRQAVQHPIEVCQAVILGLVAYYVCFYLVQQVICLLAPDFSNYNDASIAAIMGANNSFLMCIGTVVLAPPVEECFFRGLIFRNLYGKSPWLAYILSILAFAVIHILGYIGAYSPLALVMAVLQYLPAGIWLAWSYTKANTLFAPILIHAVINAYALLTLTLSLIHI